MKAVARSLVLFGMLTLISACAGFNSSSEPTAAPSETFFDQFSDIPIPSEMSIDRKRSFVTLSQEGMKNGLITATGRVDVLSLNNAMIQNMARNGWSLRAATSGIKSMQIYEKGLHFAVVYTYEEILATVMEVWCAQRLNEGAYQVPSYAPQQEPSTFVLDPTPPATSEEDAPVF